MQCSRIVVEHRVLCFGFGCARVRRAEDRRWVSRCEQASSRRARGGLTGNRPPVGVPTERRVPRFRGLVPAAGRVLRPAEAFLRALAADGDDVTAREVGQVWCLGVAENRRGRGCGARRRDIVPRLDAKATGGRFLASARSAGERRRARASTGNSRSRTVTQCALRATSGSSPWPTPAQPREGWRLSWEGLGLAGAAARGPSRKVLASNKIVNVIGDIDHSGKERIY